jgi:hypothetical protein
MIGSLCALFVPGEFAAFLEEWIWNTMVTVTASMDVERCGIYRWTS